MKNTFGYPVPGSMSKKVFGIVLSILLLLPLLGDVFASSDLPKSFLSSSEICPADNKNKLEVSFQKPCDMNHCNSHMPKCPLCPSSGSINPYLYREGGAYLPPLASSLILISPEALCDQGYVRSVFRPPTSTL